MPKKQQCCLLARQHVVTFLMTQCAVCETTHPDQLQAITIMLNSMSFCPACRDFIAW